MSLRWYCDVCGALSASRMANGYLLADRTPAHRNRRSHLLHACPTCANGLALRLTHRNSPHMAHGEASRCFCGLPGRLRIRLNTEPWNPTVNDYTHAGVLCPRHAAPLLERAIPIEHTQRLTEEPV